MFRVATDFCYIFLSLGSESLSIFHIFFLLLCSESQLINHIFFCLQVHSHYQFFTYFLSLCLESQLIFLVYFFVSRFRVATNFSYICLCSGSQHHGRQDGRRQEAQEPGEPALGTAGQGRGLRQNQAGAVWEDHAIRAGELQRCGHDEGVGGQVSFLHFIIDRFELSSHYISYGVIKRSKLKCCSLKAATALISVCFFNCIEYI